MVSTKDSLEKILPGPSDYACEEAKPAAFFESDAGDSTRREDMYLSGQKLALCLVSLLTCLFLIALDQLIVATILSTVGTQFNAMNKVGWLSSGFLISMAAFIAAWGKLSIIFGRKIIMIVAVVLFEAGSLMCAFADSMSVLIGGRVLAGIGGGGIQSSVLIIITETLPINKRPLGMALMSAIFGIASILGPLIGGVFTSGVSWRWCFYINLPIGAVAMPLFFFSFNPPRPKKDIMSKLKLIDYSGVFLMTSGLVLLLLGLTFGSDGQHAWNLPVVIVCFILGGLNTIGFCVWNFGFSKCPLIPIEVVTAWPTFAAAVVLAGFMGYFMALAIFLAIYFQVIHDASALRSGVDLLPLVITVVLLSIISSAIVKKTSYVKPFVVFGSTIGFLGCGLITLLDVGSSSKKKIGLLIPLGVGIGVNMQAAIIAGQITAPKNAGGTILATTFITFLRSIGGAIAGIMADLIYTSSFVNNFPPALQREPQLVIDELSKYNIHQLIESTLSVSLSSEAELFLKTQIMDGIRHVFYLNFAYAAILLIASIFVTNQRLPKPVVQERDSKDSENDQVDEKETES